jgi:hypothetical protein
MPKFLLKFGVAVIKEIPMNDDMAALTVGRRPDNAVVIDNPSISGHHLRFLLQEKKYYVEDLNSTNGTFLNGQKVIKAEIHDKDQIQLAPLQAMSHTFVFINERENAAFTAGKEILNSDATVIIDAAKQKEILGKMAKQPKAPGASAVVEKTGVLKIVDGAFDEGNIEYDLVKLVTYIGKGPQCDVRIKGLFAPDVAAAINRRPEAYKIIAVKEGYPKINKVSLKTEANLAEGDTIETGKTKMIFFYKEQK